MPHNERDFEIRVRGHTLVKVQDGGIRVNGKDFHNDLKSLGELIEILSNVVETAKEAGKPRLVSLSGECCADLHPAGTPPKNSPYKIINNA